MTKWARAHLPGDAEQVPGGWTIEALLVEVEDLTDNREYGLALDILYALLDDSEVPVPRAEIDRMANLAKHMNLPDSIPDRFRPE